MAAMPACFLLLLALPFLSAAQSRPFGGAPPGYARYVSDASETAAEEEYDYIVVGGGAAGCPLAATLAGPGGGRVLLLERGGAPAEFPALATAGGFVRTLALADPSPESDAPAQGFSSEDGVANVRARVLGGGTAINAGFYSRAHPGWFYGHGEGVEVPDWDMHLVNASYEWVEQELTFQPEVHGWQAAVRAALLEANVTPWNGFTVDHVTGTKIGATTFDASGRRHSAADLLAFARPGRLRVAVRATVTRVIINPIDPADRRGRSRPAVGAVGVVYQDHLLQQHHALLRPGGEVILSAGALGSPQLLLLSGIGPASDLASLGISVSADAPDVGKHMFDNPRNGISIIPSVPIDHSLIQVVGIPSANGTASYLEAASYIVPLAPMLRPGPFMSPSSPLYVTMATIMEKVPGPLSEGSLWLSSPNPLETPSVRFNYFSRPEDLAQCVVGVRRVAQVLRSRTMDIFRSPLGSSSQGRRGPVRRDFRIVGATLPLDWSTNDTSVADFCKRTVTTLWHYHGGCVVGRVVDKDFRVTSARYLRVVDGSTFSVTPGTNPQATIMMMGRYVGLKMIGDRHSRRLVNNTSS
ncbi:(R)-mandelonitrile lyase-like [Lolium rigidum]|uniref:(R)-mandelonitrile lyase-like n=1 Tax=Lolium rigidum TaxID=89674 RepID=UPI001F5CEEF9|nr:(R)-mandelonitrile lyase-like [Lolium rigidum]